MTRTLHSERDFRITESRGWFYIDTKRRLGENPNPEASAYIIRVKKDGISVFEVGGRDGETLDDVPKMFRQALRKVLKDNYPRLPFVY